MRYKVIDNKRLNVYLTKGDLQKENVTIEDIIGGESETVSKIKKIFSSVSLMADFDIKNTLLNIVLMPIVDGDLLISACIPEEDMLVKGKVMYAYSDFEEVLYAVESLTFEDTILSTLYSYEKKYYLAVEVRNCFADKFDDLTSLLSEFGQRSDLSELYIKEHGKLLIKNNTREVIKKVFFNA